ncbi:hypothetical protein ES703_106597 [subsurface metagenome]
MVALSNEIDIDSRQVLHNIGYGTKNKLPARISSLIDEYLENACHLLEPSYSCIIRDVAFVQEAHVAIKDSVTFESEVIARLLEHCHKAAIFLVTIGDLLEETVGQLAEDRLVVQATVLDAIGSVAVESVANFVQERVEEVAQAQGLTISRRFSPGYCDWDVSQQKMVFQTMKGDYAGIHLTDGCLMLPRKSISGIIGIGPRDVADYNPCKTCDKHDCVGRR